MPDLTMAKAKQLFEDVAQMEQNVAQAEQRISSKLAASTSFVSSRNEQALMQAVKNISAAVDQITGVQSSLSETTERATFKILNGEDGPLQKLSGIVENQRGVLRSLITASQYYSNSYVIWPMAISCTVAAIIGGIISGVIVKLFS